MRLVESPRQGPPALRPGRNYGSRPAAILSAAAALSFVLGAALPTVMLAQTAGENAAGEDRRIECIEDAGAADDGPVCRVDIATYVGWRVFDRHCATCHAGDAAGSSFAPSLVQRLRGFDRRTFFAALDEGYFGPDSELPPWGENPEVARYYEELWSYLGARVSGSLPPARLEPIRGRADSAAR